MIKPTSQDSYRALLVEDNEHDRIAFRRALERDRSCFELEECERGEEAIGRFSADSPAVDVVVVDFDLPGITGLELFTELRERLGEIGLPPFVMMTGAGSEGLAARAIKAGIYDYLVKDPEDRYLRLIPTVLISACRRHQQRLAYLEAQQQLANAHEMLEDTVAQRTRELRHTVRALKDEVSVRMKMERSLRESRKRIQMLSLKSAEAQENERKAIALELHDSIGGNLAAIKMNLETRISNKGDPPIEEGVSLEMIVGYLKDSIRELRQISARLRPKDLDSLGLAGAVRGLCRRIEEQYQGLRASATFDIDETHVPESLKLVLYRVIQEAVTNAAKHAEAETVSIELAAQQDALVLTIRDDGCGFDPQSLPEAPSPEGGYGLKSMRDRTELNGGTFRILSSPGGGTRLTADFQLHEAIL